MYGNIITARIEEGDITRASCTTCVTTFEPDVSVEELADHLGHVAGHVIVITREVQDVMVAAESVWHQHAGHVDGHRAQVVAP